MNIPLLHLPHLFVALGLVGSSAFLSGCALTKDKIDIGYVAMPNAPKVAGAGKVNVSATDQRPDKSKVGCKKNGYGMEMAAIESKRAVSEYFQEAMETELKNRGFRIGTGRQVNVKVTRFYNDFKMGFFAGDAIADLQMEVSVAGSGYARRIDTQGKEPNIQMALGHNAQAALEDALKKAVAQLFADPAFLRAVH